MRECPSCGGTVESVYRYCPWCSGPLRLKLVEFFPGHGAINADRALRVSRYLAAGVTGPHVRFSVWQESGDDARAEAAVSLDDAQAARLGRFLADTAPRRAPSLFERLRSHSRLVR